MDWHVSCSHCGYYGLGRTLLPGSDTTERWLWYLLIVPGLAYRLWRKSQAKTVCGNCAAPAE